MIADTRIQMLLDVDTMRDVYMTHTQRAAYNRLVALARSSPDVVGAPAPPPVAGVQADPTPEA